ncbi:MAG: DMT family transporter [Alphaproteobacteria bacterium]|nr:DMT family transporter [Alphaproteobacteria bacterium]
MNKVSVHNIKGTLYAALSGTLYGCLAYFGFKLVNTNFSFSDMLFWRFALATVALFPFVLQKNLWTSVSLYKIGFLFLIGLFVYSLGAHFYFQAAERIGSGLAMVIFFIFPLFVILLSWTIDKHTIGKGTVASITIILIGLGLLADYEQANINFMGLFLALLSGLGYAIYVYISKKIKVPPILSTFILCFGSAVLFFFLSLYQNGGQTIPLPSCWFSVVVLGIICTLLPILLLLKAMETITATKASILGVLEPLATVVIGILFLDETITLRQWMGTGIVLAGALLVQCEPYLQGLFKKVSRSSRQLVK